MPIFQPSTRKTFVAPRLPEPCFRRSTPAAFPASQAKGSDPAAYASARASAGCTSARRRPVGPALPPQQDAQRVPRERIRLAEAVVEEAHVVLLHQVRMIAEEGDRRRRDA